MTSITYLIMIGIDITVDRYSYIKYLNETTKFSVGQPITNDFSGDLTFSATSSIHPAIHISDSLTRSFNL